MINLPHKNIKVITNMTPQNGQEREMMSDIFQHRIDIELSVSSMLLLATVVQINIMVFPLVSKIEINLKFSYDMLNFSAKSFQILQKLFRTLKSYKNFSETFPYIKSFVKTANVTSMCISYCCIS